jgi:LacI family transcriptional regulator
MGEGNERIGLDQKRWSSIVTRNREKTKTPASRITMHQIAKMAGVSLGTVSHVINQTAPVREPLRQRVTKAVEKLGYQPNQLSRGLRLNRTNIIGMIIPDITNPFFPGVVRGVEDVAYKSSFRLVLCNTDNDPAKEATYLSDLKSFLPAGLLVIPSVDSSLSSEQSGPPVVCVDRRPRGWKGDIVTVANEDGGYKAARYLIEMGHRQLLPSTYRKPCSTAPAVTHRRCDCCDCCRVRPRSSLPMT